MLAYFKPTMQPFFEIILDDKGQLLPLSRGRKVEDLAFLLFGQNVASLVAENNQLVVSFWQWPAADEWIRASDVHWRTDADCAQMGPEKVNSFFEMSQRTMIIIM